MDKRWDANTIYFHILASHISKKDLTPRFIIDGTKVRDQENVKLHEL
jgi:hypothetical protein